MGLRQIAEADLRKILNDSTTGFGYLINITDPAGTSQNMTGFSNDISALIDPDTGQAVSGRQASVALQISALTALGFGMPKGISDASIKPWLVRFDDINGNTFNFKVSESNPDRAIGMVVLLLEFYKVP